MAGTSAKVEARQRARATKARRRLELREREKRVNRLVESFFVEDELRRRHEAVAAECVAELLDMGEEVADVADLLEVDVSTVRRFKALARSHRDAGGADAEVGAV